MNFNKVIQGNSDTGSFEGKGHKTRVFQDFILGGEPWLGYIWAQVGVYQGQL